MQIFDATGKRNPVDSLERLWESQKRERPRPERGRAVAILREAYGGWLEPKEVLRGERNRRGDFEGAKIAAKDGRERAERRQQSQRSEQ